MPFPVVLDACVLVPHPLVRSASKRSAYVSRVTFADLCPRIRCSAKTLTPADTAKLAAVCRKSCGVICWTFARFTAPQIRPRVGFGRGRRAPVSSSDQLVRSAGLDVTVLGGV